MRSVSAADRKCDAAGRECGTASRQQPAAHCAALQCTAITFQSSIVFVLRGDVQLRLGRLL
eukprot:5556444-Prymnesium_polylepis.1